MKRLSLMMTGCLLSFGCLASCLAQEDAPPSAADNLQMAVQEICPVSGSRLGSMGPPVKVQIGQQHAWLCCQSCVGKPVSGEHWQTIQSNLAQAQGTCPIMGKPVDATMESTVVEGRRIFVCCPPCIEKIQADAGTALARVDAGYQAHVDAGLRARSDHLHATAQGICPVSGQPLGSMGSPVKVRVGDQEQAFLCCQSCVGKKIDAAHWQTIQQNLAKAQGTCPVMGKPVDATMESTVVNGRKIFVCCPPCIEKIQADPEAYVAKLDEQIVASTGK
jgi:YHS domain-containing protein